MLLFIIILVLHIDIVNGNSVLEACSQQQDSSQFKDFLENPH